MGAIPGPPNAIAARREELVRAGIELTDLTDTNPTRHGLFDPGILEILGDHQSRTGRYDPTPRGPWSARAALADRFGGDPEDYWLTGSTSQAYSWLFTLLADPGCAVAVPTPGYPLIEPLAGFHHLDAVPYRTFYAHPTGWELDATSLVETLADKRVRALVAVNPNNPTGAYTEQAIAALAEREDVPLIADEVFFPFRLPDPATTTPQRLSGDDSVLTFGLDGLSKLLAAPQLKLAWIRLSGPTRLTGQAAQALDQIADAYLPVSSAVASALPDLLTLADSTIARVCARTGANLAIARRVFHDLRVRTAQGGWMMLLDVPHLMDADSLCVALMDRAGLAVHPGYFYDLPDSTLALSLLPDTAVFEEACVRLAAALAVFASER